MVCFCTTAASVLASVCVHLRSLIIAALFIVVVWTVSSAKHHEHIPSLTLKERELERLKRERERKEGGLTGERRPLGSILFSPQPVFQPSLVGLVTCFASE